MKQINKIRTRFAPSPTGFLHLGGARTALFNYLFTSHFKGEFIVRIEDTDRYRHRDETVETLLKDLKWLGIKIDETIGTKSKYGSYLQSERLHIYSEHAQQLIQDKKAYYCFCTKEELALERKKQREEGKKAPQYNRKCYQLDKQILTENFQKEKPYCIRLYVEDKKELTFEDLVYKKIIFNTDHVEDFVIIKNDGFPTYNFAVVIDDHLMDITHVLRGSDHLTNSSKQAYLYQSFQWKQPIFGHLNLIQFKGRQKMSKRLDNPEQYVSYYRKKGYLPEAVSNYLSLLGWTADKFKEIFQMEELIKLFNGTNLNKNQSIYSLDKLKWISRKHIQKLDQMKFIEYWLKFSKNMKLKNLYNQDQWNEIGLMFQREITHFQELPEIIEKYFEYNPADLEQTKTIWKENQKLIDFFIKDITALNDWTSEKILKMIYQIGKECHLKGRKLMLPLYWIVLGRKEGPKIDELFYLLGKKNILNHIQKQKETLNNS